MSYIISGVVELDFVETSSNKSPISTARFSPVLERSREIFMITGREKMPYHVLEMLGIDKALPSKRQMPFLLSSLPNGDNSEDLIFPQGAVLSSKKYREFLRQRLVDIERVLRNFASSFALDELTVLFSSTLQEQYPEILCSWEEFGPIVYEKLRRENWFASFKVRISDSDKEEQ